MCISGALTTGLFQQLEPTLPTASGLSLLVVDHTNLAESIIIEKKYSTFFLTNNKTTLKGLTSCNDIIDRMM